MSASQFWRPSTVAIHIYQYIQQPAPSITVMWRITSQIKDISLLPITSAYESWRRFLFFCVGQDSVVGEATDSDDEPEGIRAWSWVWMNSWTTPWRMVSQPWVAQSEYSLSSSSVCFSTDTWQLSVRINNQNQIKCISRIKKLSIPFSCSTPSSFSSSSIITLCSDRDSRAHVA